MDEKIPPGLATPASDRRDVGKREALVPFVSIVCYPCVVEPRDEHYNTQHCKENPCFQRKINRAKQASGRAKCIVKFIVKFHYVLMKHIQMLFKIKQCEFTIQEVNIHAQRKKDFASGE